MIKLLFYKHEKGPPQYKQEQMEGPIENSSDLETDSHFWFDLPIFF